MSISAKSPFWKVFSCHISYIIQYNNILSKPHNLPMTPTLKSGGRDTPKTPGLTPMTRLQLLLKILSYLLKCDSHM